MWVLFSRVVHNGSDNTNNPYEDPRETYRTKGLTKRVPERETEMSNTCRETKGIKDIVGGNHNHNHNHNHLKELRMHFLGIESSLEKYH